MQMNIRPMAVSIAPLQLEAEMGRDGTNNIVKSQCFVYYGKQSGYKA
jgi:hypothetical protein